MIFGIIATLAGIAVLTMPETRGAPLLQTPDEGEAFIRDYSCFARYELLKSINLETPAYGTGQLKCNHI